jgi:tryptophan-rich sensory protein
MSTGAAGRGRAILTAAGLALLVAVLGGLMTDTGGWYQGLEKPPWQPPDAAFGPVWTLIYALTAAAGVLAWWRSDTRVARQNLLIWFAFNAVLNVTWSLLFFRLRRPDWALSEVVVLWASILVLIVVCGRRSRLAALLLVPYLAWVSFATILNWEVVRLNGPFTG